MLGGGQWKVTLRPLSGLLPHEETDPLETESLAEAMSSEGIQRDPLIVDGRTGVVIDGNHRLAALSKLGTANAVCSEVEYTSRGIAVGRWARVYTAESEQSISAALEDLAFSERVEVAEALDLLDRRAAAAALAMTADGCFLSSAPPDLDSAFELVRRADSTCRTSGWRLGSVPDSDLGPSTAGVSLAILVCRIDKQDVLSAARERKLFPPKMSMHVIDPRPVAVNVPLSELREGSSESMEARMRAAKFSLLPSGSTYGGRKYKERLLKLSDG